MLKNLRSLLFLFFFIVATVSTALHELSPSHQAENCPICIVDEQTLSADIVSDDSIGQNTLSCDCFSPPKRWVRAEPISISQARAPPHLFS